ncbi:MAG: UbiA family prenyltransferase [Promethearchaeota archaeon]
MRGEINIAEISENSEKSEKSKKSRLRSTIKLLRIKQWYKGGVILMGMVFGGRVLDFLTGQLSIYFGIFLGFLLLGLVSSVNYIINDILDIEKDKAHHEKRHRPLPSGDLSVRYAIFIIIILIFIIIFGSWLLMTWIMDDETSFWFSVVVIVLFLNGFLYNIFLKRRVFIDLLVLSLNYIWRTMAGCIIVGVDFSPWLYIIVYEVALFLAVNKRVSDLNFLGDNAVEHKQVYSEYDIEILKNMVQMMAISLFLTYAFYCVIGPSVKESNVLNNNRGFIVFSIPVALYIILRYLYLVKKYPEIARNPEKVVKDIPIIIASLVLIMMILAANYFNINVIS